MQKVFILKLFFANLFAFLFLPAFSQKQPVWIDADTGNEIDDVYAIVRMLIEPSVNLVGLSSAHFNNPDLLVFDKWNQYPAKGLSTINISQQLNENILLRMGRSDVKCVPGADRQTGRAWGGTDARDSEAVKQLVAYVRSMPTGTKLDVICLGAMTNLVSAIILYPDIIPNIRCYLLGAQYDASKQVWNKNEFNVRNDLNAFDYLLDNDMIELIIMPVTTASPFRFRRDETYSRLQNDKQAHQLLKERWEETEPDNRQRVMWDLALIEAYLKPEYAKIEERFIPPENGAHKQKVYVSIDAEKLYDDFWENINRP